MPIFNPIFGGSPAGSDTQIQFNNSGVFGASSDFKWDNINKEFRIGGAPTHAAKIVSRNTATNSFNVYLDGYTTPSTLPFFVGAFGRFKTANGGAPAGIQGQSFDVQNPNSVTSAAPFDSWQTTGIGVTTTVSGDVTDNSAGLSENNYGFNSALTRSGTVTATDLTTQNVAGLFQLAKGRTYDKMGGTFTENNYGVYGVVSGDTPVTNGFFVGNSYGGFFNVSGVVGGGFSTAYGVYVAGVTGSTTNWGVYSVPNVPSFLGGPLGIQTVPTAMFHLPAGTAAPGTSPLKFTPGINLGIPEPGVIGYDGVNWFFTPGSAVPYKFPAGLDTEIQVNVTQGLGSYSNFSYDGTRLRAPVLQLGTNQQLTTLSTGVINKYNNIGTASKGIPALYAVYDTNSNTSATPTTTIYNTPVTGGLGLYRISYAAAIRTAASGSSTLGGTNGFRITYTDGDDSVVKTSLPIAAEITTANTTSTCVSGSRIAYCKANTAIQISMDYTSSGGTSMDHTLHAEVEAL